MQFEKTPSLIDEIFSVLIVVRFEQSLNASVSTETLLAPKLTVVNPVQPSKAFLPIELAIGRLSVVSPVQPAKALFSTTCMFVRATLSNDVQPLKAKL